MEARAKIMSGDSECIDFSGKILEHVIAFSEIKARWCISLQYTPKSRRKRMQVVVFDNVVLIYLNLGGAGNTTCTTDLSVSPSSAKTGTSSSHPRTN